MEERSAAGSLQPLNERPFSINEDSDLVFPSSQENQTKLKKKRKQRMSFHDDYNNDDSEQLVNPRVDSARTQKLPETNNPLNADLKWNDAQSLTSRVSHSSSYAPTSILYA